jgi:hypothetical protein
MGGMAEQQWEYTVTQQEDHIESAQLTLDDAAGEGWELINGTAVTYQTGKTERRNHIRYVQYWRKPVQPGQDHPS